MHPNNIHNASYPFTALTEVHAPLNEYVHVNTYGIETINFADPEAVLHLNKALLKHYYKLADWNIPEGYLCPPIPSRADYLHYLNDLLKRTFPKQKTRHILDIGTGANCIYPLLAYALFNWTAVGCDIDPVAVQAAKANVAATKEFATALEIRHQINNANIFEGIILPEEFYHATVCNPPFYGSAEEANKVALRKMKQLHPEKSILELERNFKGKPNELWCNGGEALFIKRMIKQSVGFKQQVGWFTTLVSKSDNLPKLYKLIQKLGAQHETLQMKHGSKITRVLAWRF
ncbi:23S rRNA (adenine(1618)-N(6))-methyltransferase RlmF [Rasiella rasia]|uniref:Ribosomal RNA large subunit methyltransferase F n=1 Tax=Rasiella rasia TaxID=2744027 RepID=A0A6G6GIR0_9FLAO|nr:23S rRNA (adenine(1618)-N(6))-methyltransferase RlmF [Rasiella rasia]QIE58432.1 23S rRNA (adenine(1618)-N(6))-methyltransferase RlmF [Rasiella rasia]